MRADRRTGAGARLCALLLACALGLTSVAVGRGGSGHKHHARGVAVVALSADDHLPGAHRIDLAATVAAGVPVTALARRSAGTADASTPISPTTAQSPPVRGPPAEAAG